MTVSPTFASCFATAQYFARNNSQAPDSTPDLWRHQLLEAGAAETGKPYSGPIVGEPDSYRWGNPGWDCSSFVSGMLQGVLGYGTTAYTDTAWGELLPLDREPLPGDVVFYQYDDPSQPNTEFPHMGFWLNEAQTLDCRFPRNVGVGVHGHVTRGGLVVRSAEHFVPIYGFRAVEVARALSVPEARVTPRAVLDMWPWAATALEVLGIMDRPTSIAMLATIRTEVYADLKPVREGITVAAANANYGPGTSKGAELGNTQPGDGWKFRGGGWIQTTGRNNYARLQGVTGLPLLEDSDLILERTVSAIGAALYFKDNGIPELARAGRWTDVRRAVNGWVPVPNGLAPFLGYVDRLLAL